MLQLFYAAITADNLIGALMKQLRIYRIKDVCAITGLKAGTIYKLMRENLFPQNIHLTARSTGWTSESVDIWLESKVQDSK